MSDKISFLTGILNYDFGKSVTEDGLRQQIEADDINLDGLFALDGLADTLSANGVENSMLSDATVFDIVKNVSAGNKVFLNIDRDDLENNSLLHRIKEFFFPSDDSELMMVADIDFSGSTPSISLLPADGSEADPITVPLEDFIGEWGD